MTLMRKMARIGISKESKDGFELGCGSLQESLGKYST